MDIFQLLDAHGLRSLSRPETCEFTKKLKLLFLTQELARDVAFMLPCIIFVLLSALVIESD
jgi:hypothetical protein